MPRRSEFGKGLVVCLVKFAEHYERWVREKRSNERMRGEYGNLFSESDAVERHFNGAADHLYEIKVLKEWKGTEIEAKVLELQRRGLEIGHGFTGKEWTEKEVHELHALSREIAVLIDKMIGLKPDIGQW